MQQNFALQVLAAHKTMNENSNATQMIDVGDKHITHREAIAEGRITMTAQTARLVRNATLPKGHALETARVAAIMAAKRTPDIIPLCHPLLIAGVNCEFEFEDDLDAKNDAASTCITACVRVRCSGQTGVEMEALTAVSAALLTIYDMTKGVDDTLEIVNVRLLEKRGGRSGIWTRNEV